MMEGAIALAGKGPRVLIISQESQEWKLLKTILAANNFLSERSQKGIEGVEYAAIHKPDIIIIDLYLPDMDGVEVVRHIRRKANIPVIVLGVEDTDMVAFLDAGADDCIIKPFYAEELVARIRVLLRRLIATDGNPTVKCGDLMVDLVRHFVSVGGREIFFTPKEYLIISVLAQHVGRVVTWQQFSEFLGRGQVGLGHYLHVYISALRQKLGDNSKRPRYIITENGVGYRMGT